MIMTVGDLRKEIEGLPDDAPIIINSSHEELYLYSCIKDMGDSSYKGAFLELTVFEVDNE